MMVSSMQRRQDAAWGKLRPTDVVVDSGAVVHITGRRDLLHSFVPGPGDAGQLQSISGERVPVAGTGVLRFCRPDGSVGFTAHRVHYVPGCTYTLLAVSRLISRGAQITVGRRGMTATVDGEWLFTAQQRQGLYCIEGHYLVPADSREEQAPDAPASVGASAQRQQQERRVRWADTAADGADGGATGAPTDSAAERAAEGGGDGAAGAAERVAAGAAAKGAAVRAAGTGRGAVSGAPAKGAAGAAARRGEVQRTGAVSGAAACAVASTAAARAARARGAWESACVRSQQGTCPDDWCEAVGDTRPQGCGRVLTAMPPIGMCGRHAQGALGAREAQRTWEPA